jgi:hypothetical protein
MKFHNLALWSEEERKRYNANGSCHRYRLTGYKAYERDKCELGRWSRNEINNTLRAAKVNSSATSTLSILEQGNSDVSS